MATLYELHDDLQAALAEHAEVVKRRYVTVK
jgi:hypothetical protein